MPTYDYVCLACGRSFEVVHGINAVRPTVCEVCGGELKKALSTPAIVFKGSGWAKKDARSASSSGGSSAASAAADATAKDAAAASGDASTTQAPAADKASSDKASADKAAQSAEASPSATSSTPAKGAAGGSVGTTG